MMIFLVTLKKLLISSIEVLIIFAISFEMDTTKNNDINVNCQPRNFSFSHFLPEDQRRFCSHGKKNRKTKPFQLTSSFLVCFKQKN